ncbi:uncharacterized protein Triagg1_7667 [Trichoderma aggressivum f. europaeum]|uniref:Uncharacterized protein n=1 Tax=Trichoderma aggressivum f. europaeum TaxID=173218 RepID=A0AAE1IAV4_9HYPO|nr:hypothetical protein Triagg1_7667 [Trichoderma aggressivum f. europaeum]
MSLQNLNESISQPNNGSVIDMPVTTILNGTDAIVRITTSAICGSDLHFYHGYANTPTIVWGFGHEAVGYISEVGDAMSSLSIGDYVIIVDNADSGHYGSAHPITFGTGTPGYGGLQAEYARIPFADDSLIPNPITSQNTSAELDYLMISDIFTTAWGALTYSSFQPGDSVAIFGAGPVGLLAAYSALLRGATRVYSVDRVQSRLDKARGPGAIPINFGETDPAAAILEREPNGVNRSLDCVGFEAVNAFGQLVNGIVINQMINVTAFGGGMAIGGAWNGGANSTAGGPRLGNLPGQVPFSLPALWRKASTIGTEIVLPLEHAEPVLQMVHSGKAKPGFIVSAEISIKEAPEYYQRYSNHLEDKVVIRFPYRVNKWLSVIE